MKLSAEVLRLLRCPLCRSRLSGARPPLVCTGAGRHRFGVKQGFLTFGEPPLGKYGSAYAARYAALWAFGYQTLNLGLDEPLYRTVSSLAAEALAARPPGDPPIIADCGCGVGRVAADCSRLAPAGMVLGFDGSPAMLELAARIVGGTGSTECDLGAGGFGVLSIPGRGRRNVQLLRGDVERLPLAGRSVDLALSINIIDRLPHGPERALAECRRILRPGGRLLFTDPLDFTSAALWRKYGQQEAVRGLFAKLGFEVETWFDRLPYREILDGRGSFEEFNTLVVLARKAS
jgi:SAM-dependent methyltransferase